MYSSLQFLCVMLRQIDRDLRPETREDLHVKCRYFLSYVNQSLDSFTLLRIAKKNVTKIFYYLDEILPTNGKRNVYI